MRIRIAHETRFRYDQPVRGLTQLLRLTPRAHAGQHIRSWRIEPSVDGRLRPQEDGVGNITHLLSADGPVEELVLRVTGVVETTATNGVISATAERAPELYWLRETELSHADDELREFAHASADHLRGDPLALVHRLLEAVHAEVEFDPRTTAEDATARDAFAFRKGGCRDLAHVLIAAGRCLGLPCRFVTGYLLPADGASEADARHAWVEALVPGLGWIGLDPVNGLCTGEAHIRVAVGLDAIAAAPVRSARYGGADESSGVKLRIEPEAAPSSAALVQEQKQD